MSEEKPEDQKPSPDRNTSPLPVLMTLAFFFGLFYLADVMNKEEDGSGNTMAIWVLGLIAAGVILRILVGATLKETGDNVRQMARSIGFFLVGVLILGGIGYCSGAPRDSSTWENIRR